MFTSKSDEFLPFLMMDFSFQGKLLENPKYAFEAGNCGERSPLLGASCHALLIKR